MNIVAVSAVLISALASSACTTLKPTEATPEELQRELLSGTLIQPGDRVAVADVVAAESHGKECGGAFRIYPVDAGTAITRLGPLRHTG